MSCQTVFLLHRFPLLCPEMLIMNLFQVNQILKNTIKKGAAFPVEWSSLESRYAKNEETYKVFSV